MFKKFKKMIFCKKFSEIFEKMKNIILLRNLRGYVWTSRRNRIGKKDVFLYYVQDLTNIEE